MRDLITDMWSDLCLLSAADVWAQPLVSLSENYALTAGVEDNLITSH
jgi:hypothetical protein